MLFYLAWVTLALGAVALGDLRRTVWLVLFSGWLFLPPGDHGFAGQEGLFPYWIVGGGLPSQIWLDKAWLAPTLALGLTGWQVRDRWKRLTPRWSDAATAGFCAWPLVQCGVLATSLNEAAGTACYLSGVWGASWLLGRLFLQSEEDGQAFAAYFAGCTALLAPIAVLEGVSPVRLHSLVFSVHPLAFDGAARYLGYRPQALFEHGNQYGIWCAGSLVAAFWLWCRTQVQPSSVKSEQAARRWGGCALLLGAMLLAAQSVGAILLGASGVAMLASQTGVRIAKNAAPLLLLAVLAILALHLSGIVPMRRLAMSTPLGTTLLDAIRATGRGSFAWRIGQDLKTLPMIQEHLVFGTGHWNWFAPARTRPWGLPLLLIGQFGLIGGLLWAAAILGSLLRQISHAASRTDLPAFAAVLICLMLGDAALNSFLLFPALVAAGASWPLRKPQGTAAPLAG